MQIVLSDAKWTCLSVCVYMYMCVLVAGTYDLHHHRGRPGSRTLHDLRTRGGSHTSWTKVSSGLNFMHPLVNTESCFEAFASESAFSKVIMSVRLTQHLLLSCKQSAFVPQSHSSFKF